MKTDIDVSVGAERVSCSLQDFKDMRRSLAWRDFETAIMQAIEDGRDDLESCDVHEDFAYVQGQLLGLRTVQTIVEGIESVLEAKKVEEEENED